MRIPFVQPVAGNRPVGAASESDELKNAGYPYVIGNTVTTDDRYCPSCSMVTNINLCYGVEKCPKGDLWDCYIKYEFSSSGKEVLSAGCKQHRACEAAKEQNYVSSATGVISRFDKCKASWVKASDLKTGATLRSLRSDMSSVCYNCWTSSKDKTTEAHWNPTYDVATSDGVLMMGEAGSSTFIRESTWSGDNDWWRTGGTISTGHVDEIFNI